MTFCSMLLSNKLHLWASDPATEFVKLESPRFSHFGGSAFSNDHPVDLGGRKTPYFWGTDAQMFVRGNENVHAAGCCQESRGSADLWNLAFTFDYCKASTTSTATTTTVTGTTTTNTILQALHNRTSGVCSIPFYWFFFFFFFSPSIFVFLLFPFSFSLPCGVRSLEVSNRMVLPTQPGTSSCDPDSIAADLNQERTR